MNHAHVKQLAPEVVGALIWCGQLVPEVVGALIWLGQFSFSCWLSWKTVPPLWLALPKQRRCWAYQKEVASYLRLESSLAVSAALAPCGSIYRVTATLQW